jgi:hypothetical protein
MSTTTSPLDHGGTFQGRDIMKKPNARGPSPARKAQVALGEKLNRKPKPPPTPTGKPAGKNPIPSRRLHPQ